MTDQPQNTQGMNKPSHIVYYTEKGKNGDDWKRVGAAWPNKDGKGYSVKVQDGMISLNLILREPKD